MRNNYEEHGVNEYYRRVGASYRNPHFPGVRLCMFSWLNRWWQMEKDNLVPTKNKIILFDLACGSGEVTTAFAEWWKTGYNLYLQANVQRTGTSESIPLLPLQKNRVLPITIGPEFPRPYLMATDPYTSEAFSQRTGLACDALSFKDIADGSMPSSITDLSHSKPSSNDTVGGTTQSDVLSPGLESVQIEMVICSFALHLIQNTSELFALLWELSTKVRWLIVIAPHKKPEIKDGWGWQKWNVDTWTECPMSESRSEILHDRVHCRVYKSLSV
ncbi:hypothetical protein AX17_005263 [Amanita inopinata Kibby_2008]|nr:hypothetical protein AX17_005263 [Amanita inopinata Kibby_2008]